MGDLSSGPGERTGRLDSLIAGCCPFFVHWDPWLELCPFAAPDKLERERCRGDRSLEKFEAPPKIKVSFCRYLDLYISAKERVKSTYNVDLIIAPSQDDVSFSQDLDSNSICRWEGEGN